jgi:hypothetical protein
MPGSKIFKFYIFVIMIYAIINYNFVDVPILSGRFLGDYPARFFFFLFPFPGRGVLIAGKTE